MDTYSVVITLMLVLNTASVVAYDRAPADQYRIGAPDSPGMYPLIEPATGWRRLWRPICLYTTIGTGIALAILPMFMH